MLHPEHIFCFRVPIIWQGKACSAGNGYSIAKGYNAVLPYERHSLRACIDGTSPALRSLELTLPVLRSRALEKLLAIHAEAQDMFRLEHGCQI